MRTVEIKGFRGLLAFVAIALLVGSMAVAIPVSVVWVTWNAMIGELLHGPMLAFWQAIVLTAILAITYKLLFQPQISLQVKRVKNAPTKLDLKQQDQPNQD